MVKGLDNRFTGKITSLKGLVDNFANKVISVNG